MQQFQVVGNQLMLAGKSVEQLAAIAGQTPFYAYDSTVIHDRVVQLKQRMPATMHLHYAMKANPMPAVVNFLAGLTDGLDVASYGELQIALATGINPLHISFAGPGKSDRDLDAAVAAGVIVNLESESELVRIVAAGERLGITPQVSIRVNPLFELKSSGMKMGGGPKPFGVDEERVPDMLRSINTESVAFHGFHIFTGSQNLRPEAIVEAHEKTLALAEQLAQHAPASIRWLNIGGGLGVPYFPGEKPLDLAPIEESLARLAEQAGRSLPDATLVMELGRYLVAESGVYVCEVIDRKESRGQVFLVTNGGLHHHLAASGNFGQVIRKNYPVSLADPVCCEEPEAVSIVGPLCTPLDILGDQCELPRADVGDKVVVYQSGAYGYSASPHGFLGHPAPVQIFV
jgi:diaminopimelate decarboxylase